MTLASILATLKHSCARRWKRRSGLQTQGHQRAVSCAAPSLRTLKLGTWDREQAAPPQLPPPQPGRAG
jgi:hypothetical protein